MTLNHFKKAYFLLAGLLAVNLFHPKASSLEEKASIKIYCEDKKLNFLRGNELIAEYNIQTGKNGCGKQKEGDKKTPIGEYYLSWIASRNKICGKGAENTVGNTFCDEETSGLVRSPPKNKTNSERLWEKYYGEHGVVMGLNYPNANDKLNGLTGSCIQIHGSTRMNSPSLGCIKLSDADALNLCKLVEIGTSVEISYKKAK